MAELMWKNHIHRFGEVCSWQSGWGTEELRNWIMMKNTGIFPLSTSFLSALDSGGEHLHFLQYRGNNKKNKANSTAPSPWLHPDLTRWSDAWCNLCLLDQTVPWMSLMQLVDYVWNSVNDIPVTDSGLLVPQHGIRIQCCCTRCEVGLRPSVGIRHPTTCSVKCGRPHNPGHVSTYVTTSWEMKSIHSVFSSKEEGMQWHNLPRWLGLAGLSMYLHPNTPIKVCFINQVPRRASTLHLKTSRHQEHPPPLILLVNIFTIKPMSLIPDQPQLPNIIPLHAFFWWIKQSSPTWKSFPQRSLDTVIQ